MSKMFRCLQKKLGMSAINAKFTMDAYKTSELTWRVFMTSSMKAAIHLGPNFKSNSEIYKNTQFEDIERVFNITQKLVREHSEEILNVKCVEYSSLSRARSVLANDQAIRRAKAKVCVHADSVLCVGHMKDTLGTTERWKGQLEGLRLWSSYQDAVGIDGEAIEFEWDKFPRILNIVYFLKRSKKTWRERTFNPKSSRTGSSSCQCSMSLIGQKEGMMRNLECRKIQGLLEEILARTLDVSGSWIGQDVVLEDPRTLPMENGTPQPIKWNSDSKKPVTLCWKASVLWVVESWKGRRVKITIHFNGESSNTELLFRTIHSVNQLSIYGAVTNWCEQFRLDRGRKGTRKAEIREQQCIDMCGMKRETPQEWKKPHEVQTLGNNIITRPETN